MDTTLGFSVSWEIPAKGTDAFVDSDDLRVAGLMKADMRTEEEQFRARLPK